MGLAYFQKAFVQEAGFGMLKDLWNKWWRFSSHAATFQARVLFTLVYYTLLAPIGIIFKLLQYDPLKINPTGNTTSWDERAPQGAPTLEDLNKQY
ncbi:MAG TPA: hypothetical protein ACFYD3_02605 [Candidatus Hypogeohydataceae bacterium YC41]